ncbi:hypothetical protein FACS1894208_02370 [Clostridia bacterium]|nr:hypothetical protein FACS1894208_02370 [Clostridia bacterium]
MSIKLDAGSFRAVLSALRGLYPADCPLYYSVSGSRLTLESAGGTHTFNISLSVEADEIIPLQKTTVGAFTQYSALLSEYTDVVLSDVTITRAEDSSCYTLVVHKDLKSGTDTIPCVKLSKQMTTAEITESERESLIRSRDTYTGEKEFTCPASISVAANKANILRADALYLRGKQAYCMSGDGVCRVRTPELDENLARVLDADFLYRITKLGAERYDFYAGFMLCEATEVTYKLGVPQKAEAHPLSADVLGMFDAVKPAVRVYCKEVFAVYGRGPLRVCADGTLRLADSTQLSAPYILPIAASSPSVALSETVSRAAGAEFTVGVVERNGHYVAGVSGECDIMFNIQAQKESGV